ncbi:MAG: ABC transporter permease [Gemmatimonadaceae bacterium]|nr:ABC transporter permease [Polyangiaceae bacterium]NUQ12625.1 ABC transporter permease [Gemmatimonadaceae bacterium]
MSGHDVWYGDLTTRRSLLTRGGLLIAGGLGWLAAFLLIPCTVLIGVAFLERDPDGGLTWTLTLESLLRLVGLGGTDGVSGANLFILLRSLALALVTTIACLFLAYPVAFFIARARRRTLWLSLIIVPLCTNLVIRTYAWKLLLSARLPPAQIASWLGWAEPGRDLIPGWPAVIVGTTTACLPFAVVPLYINVDRLDWSIVEAAMDLYASPARVFRQAILPQTLPGLSVAVLLTLVPTMGMFVITDMLGGAKHWLIGNLISHQFGPGRNIPYGAALSMVLILFTTLCTYAYRRQQRAVELL